MNPSDFHALGDEDDYVIVSMAKGTQAVTVHINGEAADIAMLLEAAFQAIDDKLEQVVHH